jgi:hypothetical protein
VREAREDGQKKSSARGEDKRRDALFGVGLWDLACRAHGLMSKRTGIRPRSDACQRAACSSSAFWRACCGKPRLSNAIPQHSPAKPSGTV